MLKVFDPEKADAKILDLLSKAAWQIVERRSKFHGKQRRKQHRDALIVPVHVQPTNSADKPTYKPFVGVTTDISQSGVCFVTNSPYREYGAHLELTLPSGEIIRPRLRVVRCMAIQGVYEVGGVIESQFDGFA